MWEKFTAHLQVIGAALTIPAAAGGAYTAYRSFFATDVICHNLQSSIVSVMEKRIPPDIKRGLLHKDVVEFEKTCSTFDTDSLAIFKAAIEVPRPEPAAAPRSTHVAGAGPAGPTPAAPAPAASATAARSEDAAVFGRSPAGDVRGWVALIRGGTERIGEPNFDGYQLSLTALPPVGTVLKAIRMTPVWTEPQHGPNDQAKLQGRIPAGACVRVVGTQPAKGLARTWGEVVPVNCS